MRTEPFTPEDLRVPRRPSGATECCTRLLVDDSTAGYASANSMIAWFLEQSRAANTNREEIAKRTEVYTLDDSFVPDDAEVKANLRELMCPEDAALLKDGSQASIIVVKSNMIEPGMRNAQKLSLFFNAIPAVEWAKAVPCVDIQVQSYSPALSQNGKLLRMSLISYLAGDTSVDKMTGADKLMADMAQAGSITQGMGELSTGKPTIVMEKYAAGAFTSGMEMFTMPQTIVASDAFETTSLTDPFRPLMSIDGFTLNEDMTAHGTESYKVSELRITLHDRTRMRLVAPFIAPEYRADVRLRIEYGWRHPDDKAANNPYADLINEMRLTQFFSIASSTWAFDKAGQVKIVLKLTTVGDSTLYKINLSNAKIQSVDEQLRTLSAFVELVSRQTSSNAKKNNKAVKFYGTKFISLAGAYAKNHQLTEELVKLAGEAYERFARNRDMTLDALTLDDAAARVVADALAKLDNPDTGEKLNYDSPLAAQASQIDEYFNMKLAAFHLAPDPFDSPLLDNRPTDPLDKDYATLGSIITSFIVPPLLTQKSMIDEVQIIFHTFNNRAGRYANIPISAFHVKYSDLRTKFAEIIKTTSGATTLQAFMSWLLGNTVNNVLNAEYGIVSKPDPAASKKDKKSDNNKPEEKGKTSTTSTKEEDNMAKYADSFAVPYIEYFSESIPMIAAGSAATVKGAEGVLLRIHIYDKSLHAMLSTLTSATISGMLGKVVAGVEIDANTQVAMLDESSANAVIERAFKAGIIEMNDGVIELKTSFGDVKDLLKATHPSMTFGANNSVILEASIQSNTDERASSLKLLDTWAGRNSGTYLGDGAANIQLQILPAILNTTLKGCPMLRGKNTAFVDFGTDSSIDSPYAVIKLKHEFAPGKYTTAVEWKPVESAQNACLKVARVLAQANKVLKSARHE